MRLMMRLSSHTDEQAPVNYYQVGKAPHLWEEIWRSKVASERGQFQELQRAVKTVCLRGEKRKGKLTQLRRDASLISDQALPHNYMVKFAYTNRWNVL